MLIRALLRASRFQGRIGLMGNKQAIIREAGSELFLVQEALAVKGEPSEYVKVTEKDALKGRSTKIEVEKVHAINGNRTVPPFPDEMQLAMFGMGCFWGVEKLFWSVEGVYSTQVGYSNGYTTNPFYREVCSEKTGHTEVVRVVFDPDVIPYVDLLKMFWENHDPTQGMRQRADKGTRYRSGIYCYGSQQKDLATQSRDLYAEVLRKNEFKREITTEIESAGEFYYAEDYHQQYLYKDEGSHCPLMGGTGYACPMGLLKPGTPEHK